MGIGKRCQCWLPCSCAVQQGQDSPVLPWGNCTKKYPASPPCFKVAFGTCWKTARKLGHVRCFGKQAFPVCCRWCLGRCAGGKGRVSLFPRGQSGLSEHPQTRCRSGAAPPGSLGLSYLRCCGIVRLQAWGSAGEGGRGQQRCEVEDGGDPGHGRGCPKARSK